MLNFKDKNVPGLLDFCQSSGMGYDVDVSLSKISYLRTGGRAAIVIKPKSREEAAAILSYLNAETIRYKIIGNTSNLLFLDEVNYPVLISSADMARISVSHDEQSILAEGGAMMPNLSRVALFQRSTGFEGLEGIPGTIGGGIFMNAGAYGAELRDNLIEAELALADGTLRTYQASELELTHRSSILRREASGAIVCSARFRTMPGSAQKIFAKMEIYHAKRHKYQDFMYPNLGSIFSGSPYRALGRRDKVFKAISGLYYMLNYELRLHRRESPNNRKWLNDIVVRRFKLNYALQPFSDKTLNCLVNRGQGTSEMVRFIRELERLTGGRIPLENEIVEAF